MSWFKENNFLLRKVHSLLGIVPIGAFLVEHLITNSFANQGPDVYNDKVAWIQTLPYLLWLEVGLIFIPILLHAGLGIVYLWGWKDNSTKHRYPRNFMYTFQRITGVIALVFVVYHVWEFRIEAALNDIPINFDLVAEEMKNPRALWFYVLGISSTIFHFSNGIWSFLIHWGITVGPRAQKVSAYVCGGIGCALLYIGLDALFAFVS